MSATLFKEVNYSLAKLIQDIELGEIGLPEIQSNYSGPLGTCQTMSNPVK